MALVVFWNQHSFTIVYTVKKVCNDSIIFRLVIAPQFRSSRLEMFFKISLFKNFAKVTGRQLWILRNFWEQIFYKTILAAASVNEKKCSLDLFHATGLFLHPLKTSKNLWFSDVFRGYRKRSVAWNGLIISFWEYF